MTTEGQGETGSQGALSLIAVTGAMKAAFARSRADLANATGLDVPEGWPQFPEAFDPSALAPAQPWGGYLFVRDGRIVGNGGFAGPPDPAGAIEIGFEIAPAFRNRGFATEAARQLVALAFSRGARGVVAHTAAEPNASNRVLEKLGMAFMAELPNDELGTIWRFAVWAPPTLP